MIDAKVCPRHNTDWYDITTIALGEQGKNAQICVNLDCREDCTRQITSNGYPFYDPEGKLAGALRA